MLWNDFLQELIRSLCIFSSEKFGGGVVPDLSPSGGGFDGGRSAAVSGAVTEVQSSTIQQQSSIPTSAASRLHGDSKDADTVVSEVAKTARTVPPSHTESTQHISSKF